MRPPWLLIVGLLVSVALNLFLVGAGAGIVALGLRIANDSGARPGAFLWATQAMSQPARGEVRRGLAGLRDQVHADVERSRALRIQGWDGLAAAKPDAAAIKQALAQSRQLDLATRTKVEEHVVDQVAALPPADRAAYAAGMRRALAQAGP
jgi:uncharacterized membrane protein